MGCSVNELDKIVDKNDVWEVTDFKIPKNSSLSLNGIFGSIRKVTERTAHDLIEEGVSGIIGLEAATAYWGLSSFHPGVPVFLIKSDIDKDFVEKKSWCFEYHSKNISADNLIALSDKLYVTDLEQTVCDMVRFRSDIFHRDETLVEAYNGMADIDRLEGLASYYGILNEMRSMYEEAKRLEGAVVFGDV